MNRKRAILTNLVILMALVSACQAGQTPTAIPSSTTAQSPTSTGIPTSTTQPATSTGIPTSTEQQPLTHNPILKAKLEAGETLRIMPLGDRVVEGFCDRPSQCLPLAFNRELKSPQEGDDVESCSFTYSDLNQKAVGFRGFLRDKLNAEGVNMTYVGSVEVIDGLAHEGHYGFKIGDFEYCVQNAGWLENAHPDIILFLAGTIDPHRSSPDQMLQALEKLLGAIYERMPETTEVIVAQYPTRYDRYSASFPLFFPADFGTKIAEYNAGIPGVVENLQADGKHVSAVNMGDAFQSSDDYDEAGLSPRSVAAERMAQIWLEKIMEILDRPVLVSASPTLQPSPTQAPIPPPTIRADDPLRIMPLGEAVIEGQCDRTSNCIHPVDMKFPRDGYGVEACKTNFNADNPGMKGFREFLRNRLLAAGVNMTYVGSVQVVKDLAHEGHMGFDIPDLDYCIQNAKWLEQAKPDVILFDAGGLDLYHGISPEEVIESLKGLLTHIYQELPETTEVIVAQISPVREGYHIGFDPALPLGNDLIAEYNALIPGVVEEFRAEGKHVSYVDMQQTILSTDEFDEIGGHPNVVASERMAQVWFEKIMEILGQ